MGQAIDYTLKRWDALDRFVDDGILEIDTNLENAIACSLGILKPGNGARCFTRCWAVAGGMGSIHSLKKQKEHRAQHL